MFYGLNNILKKILPKRLFYRALIIVAAPVILLQLIISIVFFDSIWIKANKGMTRSLVGEVETLFDVYKSNQSKENIKNLTDLYKKNFDFVINIKTNEKLPETRSDRRFSPMDRSLRREMKSVFQNNYWFDTVTYIDLVDLRIKTNNEIIQIFFPKAKIAPSSVRVFVLWLIVPSLLLILIAIIFLKNQTRPLVKLSKAAERFGKGELVEDLRPSGALEIRKATYEFDRMMKRINRHLAQRSEMLSGISHDLRTPLTRLKLQLAMMEKKDLAEKMSSDIDEMEKMLNDYLQFSKTQSQESTSEINLSDLFNQIEDGFDNKNLEIFHNDKIILKGRPAALKRSFENIIQNGLTYGKKVLVSLQKSSNRTLITFEDNGPGIPEDQRKNVFKPFFRLDKSRSLNKSGVGLGLAIVEDIINSHGGSIQLGKSKFDGLQVKIFLPF